MTTRTMLLLVSLIGCGGDPGPSEVPDFELPPELRFDVPAEHVTGTPLEIRWTLAGDVEGARVALRLRAPGDPLTPTSAGYLFTGSAPATGEALWIAPDGSLVADEIAVADAATSGQVSVMLPIEGDWAVDGLVLHGDDTLAHATATTWSAAATAVRLDVSRTWARPDSLVRAAVAVRGTAGEMLRLSAWLTTPDGVVHSLPSLDDSQGYVAIAEGAIEPGTIPLLGRSLGGYGDGKHLVSVKLETLEGEVRGRAGATIQVCSTPGTLQGTIAGGGEGRILVLDPLDDEAIEATTDASGAFAIELPAGRHLVLARGADWRASRAVEVGCGETIDPELTAVAFASKRGRGSQTRTPGVPYVATNAQRPRINVYHDPRGGTVGRASANTLAVAIEQALSTDARRLGGGPMEFALESDLAQLGADAIREQMSGRGGNVTQQLLEALDYDYVIRIDLNSTEGEGQDPRFTITARLVELNDLTVLVESTRSATGFDAAEQAAVEVAHDILLATGAPTRPLHPLLTSHLEYPKSPVVQVQLDKTTVAPGETIAVTVQVSDSNPAAPVEGVEVVTELLNAGLEVKSVTTNATGTATFNYVVPLTNADNSRIDVRAKLAKPTPFPSTSKYAFVARNGSGTMTLSETAPRSNGDEVGVAFSLASPVINRDVTVQALNALIPTPIVRMDAMNRGRFGIKTVKLGPGKVSVTATMMPFTGPPSTVSLERAFYAVSPLAVSTAIDPDTRILNSRVVAVKGVVLLDGVRYTNAPIALTTAGGGVLTSGIRTDSNGEYQALFISPNNGQGSTAITATVVEDGHAAEATTQVVWGPSCADCPLVVTPDTGQSGVRMRKGGVRVFVANQDVTWSASSGSISPQGVFTAPTAGGVVHVTATSVMDATKTKRVAIVVDCTTLETTGNFVGQVVTTFGTPPGVFDHMPWSLISHPFSTQVPDLISFAWGTPGSEAHGSTFPYGANGLNCAFSFDGTIAGGPCGSSGVLTLNIDPNLDEPGNTSRKVTASASNAPNGVCTEIYRGSGILRRP